MCKDAIVFNNKPTAIRLEAGVEYFMCTCGRSKDGVFCDGNHSYYTDEEVGNAVKL